MLLPHLLDHNRDHVKDIEKWTEMAEQIGNSATVEEMKEIVKIYMKASIHLEKAIDELGKNG